MEARAAHVSACAASQWLEIAGRLGERCFLCDVDFTKPIPEDGEEEGEGGTTKDRLLHFLDWHIRRP